MAAVVPRFPAAKQRSEVSVKIRFIAQLLLAEIAPLVTAPETVYDHRG